jgi:glycerate 2-kinase
MTPDSFAAGRALLRFVDECDGVLFLISGGGSACVETPLEPWFDEDDLTTTNARLIEAGLPVGQINIVRKQLSAIKGGRLAAHVRGRRVTLIYSDVAPGAFSDVASGPTVQNHSTVADAIAILQTLRGCEHIVATLGEAAFPASPALPEYASGDIEVIADNRSFTAVAAEVAAGHGYQVVALDGQLEGDVEQAARILAAEAARLSPGQLLVVGGEPTVVVAGDGRGGRCSELALRFSRLARDAGLSALFGSSDGVDGNSGAAGIYLSRLPSAPDLASIEAALDRSDSFPLAARIGEPIIIPPTGNNLRDLILLTRGWPGGS